MNEQLPDGKALAKDLDAFFKNGGKFPEKESKKTLLPVKSDPKETKNSTEVEELFEYQVKVLESIFRPADSEIKGDIRGNAEFFKNNWDRKKAQLLSDPTFPRRDWVLLNMTDLFGLSNTANKKHLEFVRKSGQALPGSSENNLCQLLADRWGRVCDIVKAASEIKD